MLYGAEVCNISDKSLALLENTHWAIGRTIQGLSRTSPNPTVLPSIGWLSISSIVDKMQLDFLMSILNLENGNIYRKAALLRILQFKLLHTHRKEGPVMRALTVASKYEVINIIYDGIDSGEFMTMTKWKGVTDKSVRLSESNRWLMTCTLYGHLNLYKDVMGINSVWPWWRFTKVMPTCVKGCMIFLRMLAGDRLHLKDDDRNVCSICHTVIGEKTTHLLFECNTNRQTREHEWQMVIQKMPLAMEVSINDMCSSGKAQFLASGFRSSIVIEWSDLYKQVLSFVGKVYRDFVSRLDE